MDNNNNQNTAAPLNVAAPTTPPPTPNPETPVPVSSAATAGIPQPQPAPVNPPVAPPTTPPAPTPPTLHKKGGPMMWVIILLTFAFVCGLVLAAWYFQTQLQKASPSPKVSVVPTKALTPTKNIIIGTDGTFQPMEYMDKNNDLIGYDIDLGNKIAAELKSKAEFKNIPWDDIFKALENKEIDMVMSSVTITDERKAKYDFSDNYLNAGQVIIAKKDNTTITTAETLKGKKIAVQEGTTNEKEALKLTSANLVIRYPDFVQATKALVDGQADAIISDLPAAKGITTANPTLKITTDPFTNDYYGIVFRKGDPNIKKINAILSSMRTKGILTDLKQKWLD